MNKKTYRNCLVFVLVAALVVTSFPSYVFGDTVDTSTPQTETQTVGTGLPQGYILSELPSERERSVKHYLKDDGTYEAVVYPNPVHFMEDGTWQDIDNRLIEADSIDKTGEKVYKNTKNEFSVELSKSASSKKTLLVAMGGYQLEWGLEGTAKSDVTINSFDENALDKQLLSEITGSKDSNITSDSLSGQDAVTYANEKIKTLTNLMSSVTYSKVLPSVDLEYVVQSNEVKENLILQSPIGISTFNFNLNLKNLTPVLQKDGSLWFIDSAKEKEPVFVMQAPYMYDAKGEISNAVAVTLKDTSSGYVVSVTPDEKWLKDENRAYPVTIDPPITTSLDRTDIFDAHVVQSYPDTNYQNSYILKSGYGASSQINRSYLKFTLPTLSSGSMIIDAKMTIFSYTTVTDPRQVDVHKVTEAWSSDTVTWNNRPSYSSTIEDYQLVQGNSKSAWTFEITSIAKDWYTSGSNNGVMIRNKDETTGYMDYYSSDCSDAFALYRPQVNLYYINNGGLESYWSYHTQDNDRAGTGYVNDYNGNLIISHNDLTMSGNRMPLSIQHIYNSCYAEVTQLGDGNGWRTTYDQKLLTTSISGTTYYYYQDEDCTKHYFYYDTSDNKYKDEDGLNLVLAIGSNSYVVTDKEGGKLYFNGGGYLTQITDKTGNNSILVAYTSSNRIDHITDGAGRVAYFLRDTSGMLTGIKDPANRTTSYTYDTSNNLTRITYPDGKYSTYTYDTNKNLTSVTNIDGHKVSYTYSSGISQRILSAKESHTDGTLGDEVAFSYGSNITTFTDSKGKKSIYQFNDWGNTMNTKDSLGYARYVNYNETSGSASKNRSTLESKLQKTVANYLYNHGMEEDSDWTYANYTGSTGTGAFTTTNHHLGARSYKIVKTNATSTLHCSQEIALTPGKTYTYTGYVKTENMTTSGGGGARIFVRYQDSAGVWQTECSNYIYGNSDWQRLYLTFTIPSDAYSGRVFVRGGITGETGTAYYDCLQVEDGAVGNRYNIIENGDFRNTLTSWAESSANTSSDLLTTVTSPANVPIDSNAYKFVGDPEAHKNICQTLNISGTTADTFVLSGWAKGESVPITSGSDRRFGLMIGFVRTDGTTDLVSANYNQDASDWQYMSFDAKSDAAFTSIKVYCRYNDNVNNAYFDGIRLYKEEFGDSYTYDDEGNQITTVNIAKQCSTFQYSAANDLIRVGDPKLNEHEYVYNAKHSVTSANTPTDEVYSFSYGIYGNPLTMKIGCASDSNLHIDSSSVYVDSNNYLGTLTDPSGNAITNDWNPTKGVLDTMTDGRGKTTSYTYDGNTDQLTQVSKTVGGTAATVGYAYSNDKLSTITRNGFSYVFDYDSLGNNTTVKAGTQTLITNTFEAKTSLLTSTAYANGQTINYVYDETNRVIQRKYGPTVKFTYEYDSSGNLGYHQDLQDTSNVREYRYVYDVADRLTSVFENNGNELTYSYDANNNTSKIIDKVGGVTHTTEYAVDPDNRPTDTTWTAGQNWGAIVSYDALGRTTKREIRKTVSGIDTVLRHTDFSYLQGVNGSSTSKVGTVNDGGVVTTYAYDSNGNISTITKNGQTIAYFYDELNQLIRENNQVQNQTITYTYNIGGNMTERKTYAYTAAEPIVGIPTSTITSSYNDSNWKDKLTSFNGNAITYDAVGNPLTSAGYTYSWEAGKQLAGITGNGKTISYTYNDQGIRQSKTVNGVTTTYRLVGDRVSWEGNGTDSLYYTYDGSGNLISVNLNGTEYFYTRNLQGDVTGLIDSTGAQVVTYTYDSWGKVLSVTGSLASTLGEKNPYRYRGYRLDSETGMYYLNSRYYVPEWGRFLNGDATSMIHFTPGELYNKNLYAYCDNDPINRADPSGRIWTVGFIAIGALVSSAAQIVSNIRHDKPIFDNVAGAFVGGAVFGAISSTGNVVAAGYAAAAAESLVNDLVDGKGVSPGNLLMDTICYGTIYAITGKIADKIVPINKGWFSPKSLKTMINGNYSRKLTYGSVVQELGGGTAKSVTYPPKETCQPLPAFGGGGGGGHYAK
jgi:RHS repeat-associated protein